jgi:zinc protease
VRLLNMAARILSTRMVKEVREDAQLVYSIGASSRAANAYPGFGFFGAAAPTDPGKTDALVKKLQQMYETFAKEGPTAEELAVAKKQFENTFVEQVKEPSYWLARMNLMTYRNASLDDALSDPAAYQQMTAEEVKAAFAKYWSNDNAIVVVVRPGTGQ